MSILLSNKKIHNDDKQALIELMFWKKEFRKVLKDLDSEEIGEIETPLAELKKRKINIEKMLDSCERKMYKINKGMYFGIGRVLNDESSPVAVPVIGRWSNLNNHVGFKGTTRVGKTINMLSHIEQCVAKGMDVIVFDPKGGEGQEVLSSVVETCMRYDRGEDLMYISPAFPSISQRINVCYGLSNVELSGGIVESIKTEKMDSFYLETANEILMAILSSFEYLQEISDPMGSITKLLEQKEMKKYYAFLKNRKEEETYSFVDDSIEDDDEVDDYKRNVEDEKLLLEFEQNGFNRSMITFRELEHYCHYRALRSLKILVETLGIDKTQKYRKDVKSLKRDALVSLNGALATEEAHFAKVSKTLSNRMAALSVGPIGELLCGIRINPLMNRILRKDKGVVCVVQPFPMKYKGAADVFNKMLLGMIDGMAGTVGAEGKKLPRRVALFIDEAGAIAYPGIENFFNRAGGLGITVFVYTQTDEDYTNAVGDTLSNVILGNINTTGIMRLKEITSKLKAAEEIGMFKQRKTMAMISTGAGSEGRYTTDDVEAYICEPKEIGAFPVGEGILMHEGETYYMEFPFRRKPVATISMPSLDSEVNKKLLSEFERRLEEEEVA